MISQLSPPVRRPSQLYFALAVFAMLPGAWLLRCHKYPVLACAQLQLPGIQAEDAALTQHGRNARSQLSLGTALQLVKLLGPRARG